MTTSLLPPGATPLERAIDASGAARIGAIPDPLATLKDPAHCPVELLPFLAWEWGADGWDADWSEAEKRTAVADAIRLARIKGSVQCVEDVLARHDALAELIEWHQQNPRGTPGTFEVQLPVGADGGTRATAAFARAIIEDVIRHKPLSAHFAFVHRMSIASRIGVFGVARSALFARRDMESFVDDTRDWANLLTTEIGEPLTDDAGDFLEVA